MAIRKEHILVEIRRIADENAGRPPGQMRLASEAGIKPHDWQWYWARWSDALL